MIRSSYYKNDIHNPLTALKQAFEDANQTILSQTSKKYNIAATTAISIFQSVAYVACVGNIVVYLFRNGRLEKLTEETSFLERLFQAGLLTEDEYKLYKMGKIRPLIHRVPSGLGSSSDLYINLLQLPLSDNDLLLLCTDGICDFIDQEEIYETLQFYSPDKVGHQLVKLSKEREGYDSATALLVAIQI